MGKKVRLSAGIAAFGVVAILALYQVQGEKMPLALFIIFLTFLLVVVAVASVVLVYGLIKALLATEWRLRLIYRIRGIPKNITLGNQQIPITLGLGTTRYVGRGFVYFVKEKGAGRVVSSDLVSVEFDTEKANFSAGIRKKGEELPLVLQIYAKSPWKGWLSIGFTTEDNEIPYIHFPITVK